MVQTGASGDDVEGDGDEQGDDGHKGHFQICKSSYDMDFEDLRRVTNLR